MTYERCAFYDKGASGGSSHLTLHDHQADETDNDQCDENPIVAPFHDILVMDNSLYRPRIKSSETYAHPWGDKPRDDHPTHEAAAVR